MATVNLEFQCENVSVNPDTGMAVIVSISEANINQVLSSFDETDIVGHFDTGKLLDQMDIQTIKDHLGLTHITEE